MTKPEIAALLELPHVAIVAYACHLRHAADHLTHTVSVSPSRLAEALSEVVNRRRIVPSAKAVRGALAKLEAVGLLVKLPDTAGRYLLPMLPILSNQVSNPVTPEASPAVGCEGYRGTNHGIGLGASHISNANSCSNTGTPDATLAVACGGGARARKRAHTYLLLMNLLLPPPTPHRRGIMRGDWSPLADEIDEISATGVPKQFALDLVAEYKRYWLDRREPRPWRPHFLNHCKTQWRRELRLSVSKKADNQPQKGGNYNVNQQVTKTDGFILDIIRKRHLA